MFPLPPLTLRLPASWRGRQRLHDQLCARKLVNLWIGILNFNYDSAWSGSVPSSASTPQSRVLAGLLERAQKFLRRVPVAVSGGEQIRESLRIGEAYSGAGRPNVPLGLSAGVPHRAACVDAASVLKHHDPELAAQCTDPYKLLFDPSLWTEQQARDFVSVDAT